MESTLRSPWWRCLLRRLGRLAALFCIVVSVLLLWTYFTMIRMPGESYRGELPVLTEAQAALRDELRGHVEKLAGEIGARNTSHPAALKQAAAYISDELRGMGYDVELQTYPADGVSCSNIIVELAGSARADEIVIVGAHYDTCYLSPGADDNASAVAGVLALARRLAGARLQRTVRLACFVNEEPPHFRGRNMGSRRYAARCRQRDEAITAMVCLEMIGCYRTEPGSQRYPIPGLGLFYPRVGNYIGFVGNLSSRRLVHSVTGAFRREAAFPSEGAALPGWAPGVGLSDHWSFWRQGYPAVMVTDTAFFRYDSYHSLGDRPEKLDYESMARVVDGLEAVLRHLANTGAESGK